MTVCTISRAYKRTMGKYMLETCDSLDSLDMKLVDFGYRGASSVESAAIGDAAHLVNCRGEFENVCRETFLLSATDTVAGLRLCRKFYDCPMAGYSVPASEHR